ncbi:MAG: CooT family nickel-binding protein [Oscillospiraceae bacterium]|jgi:predicted RNA-binding protein
MCLSTAYEIGPSGDKMICDRVTSISVDGDSVRLVNLLGQQTVVKGSLKDVDLNKNIIRIEAK